MKIHPLSEYPRQTQSIIRYLDHADVLLTNLLVDANRDQDAQHFSMPHEDLIVYLEIIQQSLNSGLNQIADCAQK